MARKRTTHDQIQAKLRGADILLAQGDSIAEASRKFEVGEQTWHAVGTARAVGSLTTIAG